MSMYNMLFGECPFAKELLAILGLDKNSVGRYRDCYLVGKDKIGVHTRNGGGNREAHEHVFEALKKHPNYLYDEDDDFDCTYATIYFSIPEVSKKLCETLAEQHPTVEAKDKWKILLEALRNEKQTPETERALMVAKGIFEAIEQPLKDAVVRNETGQIQIKKS